MIFTLVDLNFEFTKCYCHYHDFVVTKLSLLLIITITIIIVIIIIITIIIDIIVIIIIIIDIIIIIIRYIRSKRLSNERCLLRLQVFCSDVRWVLARHRSTCFHGYTARRERA